MEATIVPDSPQLASHVTHQLLSAKSSGTQMGAFGWNANVNLKKHHILSTSLLRCTMLTCGCAHQLQPSSLWRCQYVYNCAGLIHFVSCQGFYVCGKVSHKQVLCCRHAECCSGVCPGTKAFSRSHGISTSSSECSFHGLGWFSSSCILERTSHNRLRLHTSAMRLLQEMYLQSWLFADQVLSLPKNACCPPVHDYM